MHACSASEASPCSSAGCWGGGGTEARLPAASAPTPGTPPLAAALNGPVHLAPVARRGAWRASGWPPRPWRPSGKPAPHLHAAEGGPLLGCILLLGMLTGKNHCRATHSDHNLGCNGYHQEQAQNSNFVFSKERTMNNEMKWIKQPMITCPSCCCLSSVFQIHASRSAPARLHTPHHSSFLASATDPSPMLSFLRPCARCSIWLCSLL